MWRLLMVSTLASTVRAFLLPFAQHFRAGGWRVDAAAFGIDECDECVNSFDHVWSVPWSRNPLNPQNFLLAVRTIYQLVDREQYHLVHVHTPVAAFITRYALRTLRGRVRVVYTAHGFHFHSKGKPISNTIFLNLERVAALWTDYLVVINEEDYITAVRKLPLPRDRIWHIPGVGIDTSLYAPERISDAAVAKARAELGLQRNEPLFLMIAEFVPNKRHRDLLQAFSKLQCNNAHLAFAGTGPLEHKMRVLAERLGIARRVHFLGFRRDIPILIRASVATVLPSEREGLPRSVMESMSLEVPVIASDIRGNRDLLGDGRGLLFQVGDVLGLTRALKWVLEHPIEAQEMARRARAFVIHKHDLSHVIAKHEELYEQALASLVR